MYFLLSLIFLEQFQYVCKRAKYIFVNNIGRVENKKLLQIVKLGTLRSVQLFYNTLALLCY